MAACGKDTIANPDALPHLNDVREQFHDDVILKRHDVTHLSANFASFLPAMARDDLEDCAVLFEWIIGQEEYLPVNKAQVLNVFAVGYFEAANKKLQTDQSEIGLIIQSATKNKPELDSANCEEGPFRINGRYLTMDKLVCDRGDLTGQTREELEAEYWALSDFCYDIGWHYIKHGHLKDKSLKFAPPLGEE